MGTQLRILGVAFIVFAVVAALFTQLFSLAYIGLVLFGVISLVISYVFPK
ncbi:MAG TPA: hypothetical protein VF898_07160 [Chloroflexota bacterium]